MEAIEPAEKKLDLTYRPGTIKRIQLSNFMCHDKFDLELGPRVNFIIGPNGSGKSALLTAIVVVLGGRATNTSRAKRVGEFVQEGKKVAKITCTLVNFTKVMDRDQAFMPDEFGPEISIEKTIFKDDCATKLVIKNSKGGRVSERKTMLDEILDHFKILINNPICILNQEVSKSFLHSKRPEDKFDLFMKATNLEQIEADYKESEKTCGDWGNVNLSKSVGFKLLDKENQECKQKINYILNRLKLVERKNQITEEMMWAGLLVKEEAPKALQAKLKSDQAKLVEYSTNIEKSHENIGGAQSEIVQIKEKIDRLRAEAAETNELMDNLRKKEGEVYGKKVHLEHNIDSGKRRLKALELKKSEKEDKIKKVRQELGRLESQVEEEARRKREVDILENDINAEKSNETTKRQHATHLNNSMTEIRNEISRSHVKANDLNSDLLFKNNILKKLLGGRESALKKYGDHMVMICEQVEAAHKKGMFTHKPCGPLGVYLKLRQPKLAKSLELHLGKTAHAFLVDNYQDMARLASIFRNVRGRFPGNFLDPIILTRKFNSRRHDVCKFKADSAKYKTFLDLLEIEDVNVYNALVDRNGLEQVLFIEDYFEAQNAMMTPSNVPRGTRCAYTEGGDTMYPRTNRTGFRIVAANSRRNFCLFTKGNDEQIATIKAEIEESKVKLDIERQNLERLQKNYEEQRAEFVANQKEIAEISSRLREKESVLFEKRTIIPTAQPQELSLLESEVEDIMKQIRDIRVEIETVKLDMERINEEYELAVQKKQLQDQIQTRRNKEICKQEKLKDEKAKLMIDLNSSIEKLKKDIAKLEKSNQEDQLKLEEMYKELDAATSAVSGLERPSVIKSLDELKSESESIERQLNVQIDDNQDPQEQLAKLEKRRMEIVKTGSLKEYNEKNFKLSERTLKDRKEGLHVLQQSTCASVGTTFGSVMRAMDMEGKLEVHMIDKIVDGKVVAKARTLEMQIDTSASQRPSTLSASENNSGEVATNRRSSRAHPDPPEGPQSKRARLNMSPSEKENKRMTDTRSLSGGERSFSTVAFVLALWHHCASPFKLMDEIDVFMDMVTRRTSYGALIKFAEVSSNTGQFIYFSPLQLPEIEAPKGLVKVLAMPVIIRRGQSQAASLETNGLDDG